MSKSFKHKLICFFVVLITFAVGFIMPFLSRYIPQYMGGTTVKNATVSSVNLKSDEDFYLSGEWQFFKGTKIISEKLENPIPDLYVQIPSSWTSYKIGDQKLSNGGVASYRAYIKNLNTQEPFIITVPNIVGKCDVFIDGVCVYSNRDYNNAGEILIGADACAVGPDNSKDKIFEVVIEVECEFSSGLTSAPVLSEYAHFKNRTISGLALKCIIIGVVLFFAVAVLFLSVMRKDSAMQFWLVVLCLSFVFRMLISNNGYIASSFLFSGINHEIMMSLIFVSTYIIKLSMMMHLNDVASLNIKQNTMVFISALFLICAFVPYFLYDYIYVANAYIWLQSVPYILDAVMIYKLVEAILKKRKFSSIYLVAYCISTSAVIIDNYYINGYISKSVSWVMPMACIFFITCMVLIHFLETVEAFSKANDAARLSRELSEMNMTLMLSQIQPHFLYNALNTIKYLIKKDPKAAESAVVKFSGYLRANMDSLTQKEPIPFKKELDHVKNYISIESLRFGERLNVEYDIEFEDFKIPPLTVQPIAENAIKHGVNQKAEGGTVKISTREDGGNAVIIIEDDGVGFDVNKKPDDNRSHVGINNIITRLKEMMNAKVEIQSTVGEGTKVTITIPKEERVK